MKKIAIIGGGINGLCSAYYLVKAGFEVTILDKGSITDGASFVNAGYVTPSHFIPFAAPGMINQGIKWMFNSSSPFYVKPRWDTDFFKWAWNFKKSATNKKVEKAIPVLKEINIKSRDLYMEMLDTMDFNFHMEKKGLLMVYKSEENQDHELKLAERGKELGLEIQALDTAALHKLEPGFKDDVIGGVHYECDTHSTPNLFMKNLKSWLKKNGVQFLLEENVTRFDIAGKAIKSVHTQTKEIFADEFVLAAGSWTFELAKQIGLNIPIQAGKGYSINTSRETGIKLPAILTEAKVAVTPMNGFTRFAGTMEISGSSSKVSPVRVGAIANAASSYYKGLNLTSEEKEAAASGLRPLSPDGLPYIGKTQKYNNLSVLTGHAMMGWSLGPISGKLIAEIISDQKPSIYLRPFKVDRF